MRILLSILICFLFISPALSQEDQDEKKEKKWERFHPFMKRKPGLMRLYSGIWAPPPDRADKFDRFNTHFFWNSWIGDVNNVKTKFYAIGHEINLMFDVPFGKKGRVGLGIGLGYSHFSVRSNGEFQFIDDGEDLYSFLAPYSGPKRWINRSVFNFVEVPFELRFRSARERGKFKFYPGFKAGLMFEYFHKHRIEGDEFKEFNFPQINPWHFGPTFRMGVDNIMIFGYYDLAPIFKDEKSSHLQLFGAGISIGWF
ncbi:MAG: hypothetical protein HUJ25_02935 [Crocinitomicaceae bacterium]|nr:hypothetical protein [Crocinitomicaceae bacterium]